MARSIDSDYLDLSLHGFNIGIDFDVFEGNMRRIMEIPIKYLDSAHGKAVELIEDVHAMLWDTFPDGEVQNELHDTVEDPSNRNVSGSLPTSVETKLVGADDKVSNREFLISVENGKFSGSNDMDAHESDSVLTKNPESFSSQRDHVNINDLCLLPKDTLTTEVYDDSTTSEEIILWNPENSAKPPQLPEVTTIVEDSYEPDALDTDKVTEQVGLHCSAYSENSDSNYEGHIALHSAEEPTEYSDEATALETFSQDLSADVFKCAADSTMCPDDMAKFVSIHLGNGQEDMKNDKCEASYASLPQNASFKKMVMRQLSRKLWWRKKPASVQQAVPGRRSAGGEGLGCQLAYSSDDLDDDWEVV